MTNTSGRSLEGMVAAAMFIIATVRDGLGPESRESGEPAWVAPLRTMTEALSRRDHARALRAHQDAHAAVLAARSWEGMLEVGAAALHLGPAAGSPGSARGAARRMYLWALVRARGIGSLQGVLRAGEAFAALGDRDMTALSLRIAEGLRPAAAEPLADRLRAELERMERAAARHEAYGEGASGSLISRSAGNGADGDANGGRIPDGGLIR